jgi:hypothetical protein
MSPLASSATAVPTAAAGSGTAEGGGNGVQRVFLRSVASRSPVSETRTLAEQRHGRRPFASLARTAMAIGHAACRPSTRRQRPAGSAPRRAATGTSADQWSATVRAIERAPAGHAPACAWLARVASGIALAAAMTPTMRSKLRPCTPMVGDGRSAPRRRQSQMTRSGCGVRHRSAGCARRRRFNRSATPPHRCGRRSNRRTGAWAAAAPDRGACCARWCRPRRPGPGIPTAAGRSRPRRRG